MSTSTPSFIDTSAVNGQIYYYRAYPVDASMTVGYGSLEVQAKPRSADTTPDPHVYSQDSTSSAMCMMCHDTHAAATFGSLLRAGTENDYVCLQCHSLNSGKASIDTSSELSDPLNQSAIPIATPAKPAATLQCTDCHRVWADEASSTAGLLSVGGTGMTGEGGITQGDAVCYSCHGAGSTLKYGDMSGFESSAHVKVPDPPSGSEVKCLACHEHHTSRNTRLTRYEGYMVCAQCHSAATGDPNQPDVWSKLTLNNDANSKHPLLPQDQVNGARMTCQNCHNTHSTTKTDPLVDPHNPSTSGTWTGNLSGDAKSYCFLCHDGKPLPTSAETTPWADPVRGQNGTTTVTDMKSAYDVNVHGYADASDPTTTTDFLRPDMGYSAGDTLDCTACHDPHGTSNNFSLLTKIKSADGTKTVSGVLVYKIPAGSITSASPVGYDTRFFCSTCHLFDPATHDPMAGTDTTVFGKTDCNSCHSHVKSGAPSTGL